MSFRGHKPTRMPRLGGLIDWDDPVLTVPGLANLARNVRYFTNSTSTRYGLRKTMQVDGDATRINGAAMVNFIDGGAENILPLIFDSVGILHKESPAGSGTMLAVTGLEVSPPAGAFMQATVAYNRAYLAWGDLKRSLARPAVYSAQHDALERLSEKPYGDDWQPSTAYFVGQVVSPSPANAHLYICTAAGMTASAPPSFPTGSGATVTDGTVTWKESTIAVASTVNAGNVAAGTRFVSCLFVNNNDYISGMGDSSAIHVVVAADGFTLQVSNLPIGPANTKKRIVISTVQGDSQSGRYFYIPKTEVIEGVTMSKMVIEDNVTTSIELNFTDTYLGDASDVSNFFEKIEVPECVDAFYSETLNRMVYSGCKGFESGHLVSQQNDPESVLGTTGVVQVAENNGELAICWREMLGNQYSLKEESGHLITFSGTDPSGWAANQVWKGMGPSGPRAVAVVSDIMIFAHRSGLYRFTGSGAPVLISQEIKKTWNRINWQFKHLISVHIDEVAQEVRVFVPLDNSTVPSHCLTMNYVDGWDPMTLLYRGVPLLGRKWSVDDISAYGAITARRVLTVPVNAEIDERQVLILSADSNTVRMIVPGVYDDDGAAIDSQYQPAYVSAGGTVLQFGGFNGSAHGAGDLVLQVVAPDDGDDTELRRVSLDEVLTNFEEVVLGQGEHFGVLIMSDRDDNLTPIAGAWFHLHDITLWVRPFMEPRSR